ncbi:MAG TPA: glycosyltransferase family 2 protein [Thermoanaerobaculia bacterium]
MSGEGLLPFVSVVMPVRNEAAFIARSLGAVLAQDYPRCRMEVIVADGMSDDATRDLVRATAECDPRVRLVDNRGRIAPTALNAAFSVARGEIVVRVDGHCEIAPDYVSRCVAHLSSGEADGVGGPLETVGETPVAQVIALAMSSGFGVGGSPFRTRKEWSGLVDTVAFPAYTREALVLAGPFDEELIRNQDDEYNYRLRSRGARILLAADVRSRYYSRGTLRSLFRQYFQYGLWKVRVLQKHLRQMRPRQFIPPVFAALLIVGVLAAPFSAWARFGLLGITAAYAGANVVASVLTGRAGPFPEVFLLPVVYTTLHVSYGFGFLAGLVHFHNRWRDILPGSQPAGRHEGSA